MAENSYPIEVKIASSEGWFTPEEARAYYGRYDRSGITAHWWGGNETADKHDAIVGVLLRGAEAGTKSANYVVSDIKITCLVLWQNVAFASQSGNPTTISLEFQPTLGAEGYKKGGWLINELEELTGRTLTLYPHKYWNATECPGTIDLNRLRAEANKWKAGQYDQAAPPVVVTEPPKTANLEITDITNKKVRLIRDANLWDLHFTSYAQAQAIKSLPKGTEIEVSATAKHQLGSTYYLSEYSFQRGIGNGINIRDTEDVGEPATHIDEPPVVTPPKEVEIPVPLPTPPEPPVEEAKPTPVDEEQNDRLSAIEAFINAIKAFFSK
jgi:hypothetical protein